MDFFFLTMLAATSAYLVNARQQRRRIALLSEQLAPYQVERLMQTLTEGYLRAMGEASDERRQQVLSNLAATEEQLCQQFDRFVAAMARVPAEQTRVSRLPIGLPFALQLLPAASFDLRDALAVHARGVARTMRNDDALGARERAFTMTAELLLMQHTCHWFCKSKAVASARMLARHQTPHAQLLASVSPATRSAYRALTGSE